jgi:2-keto-4-pentenoate hydratase
VTKLDPRINRAAQWLHESHLARRNYTPVPLDVAPRSIAEADAIQEAFVALKAKSLNASVAGYKVAITTQAMRDFTRFQDSIPGVVLDTQVQRSPGTLRLADFGKALIECELAFEFGEDVSSTGKAFDRTSIGRYVSAVMPAFEIADDRNADYKTIADDILSLAADNAWNEGAVLGAPVRNWHSVDLGAVHGVAKFNGAVVGEGYGRDVLGHPLEALAWLANRLLASGRVLRRGHIVLTGSLVASKFPQAGDRVDFSVAGLGSVALRAE